MRGVRAGGGCRQAPSWNDACGKALYSACDVVYRGGAVFQQERRTASRPQPQPGRAGRLVRLLLLACAVVVVIDALVGERGLLAMRRARREYAALAQRLDRQRQENAQLREVARRLREDPRAIEEVARRDLGLIRQGETLFIIRDAEPAAVQAPPAASLSR
jgi:cell division protein FtsB